MLTYTPKHTHNRGHMQPQTPTLNAHILALLIKPTLLVGLGLLTLVWLMQSLRFLDLMINKGLSVGTFLHLISLLIPFLLTVILPFAILAGVVYAFKIMNDENELPAMFGAGLTRKHLIRPALWLGLFAMLFGYVNSFYLTPASMTTFKRLQHELRHTEGHLLLEEGTFNPLGDDVMVFLKNRVGRTGLNMMLVHDTRNPDKPVTWMAKRGEITFSENNTPRLTLNQGIRQEVTPTQTSMLAFEEHTLDIERQISQNPPDRVKKAKERFMHELAGKNEKLSPRQKHEFTAEQIRRLIGPTTPLILTLMAGAFLIVPRATRRGIMRPVLITSVSGILYIMLIIGLSSAAENGNPYILYGQIAVPFIALLTTLFYLRERCHG